MVIGDRAGIFHLSHYSLRWDGLLVYDTFNTKWHLHTRVCLQAKGKEMAYFHQ